MARGYGMGEREGQVSWCGGGLSYTARMGSVGVRPSREGRRPRPWVRVRKFVVASAGAAAFCLGCCPSALAFSETVSFTGHTEDWVVPAGIQSLTFDLYGAQGGGVDGGLGGRATATLNVSPGQHIFINAGGAGKDYVDGGGPGGFNGGGGNSISNGGGGATDIRAAGVSLSDRVLVAGGGGGAGGCSSGSSSALGGNGGGDAGNAGSGCGSGGGGGSQATGGTAAGTATSGTSGQGGEPAGIYVAGGGGGGWFGGGGGFNAGGGGGGSGHGPSNAILEGAVNAGNGFVVITDATPPSITITGGPGSTPSHRPSFSFATPAGVAVECSLGNRFTPCASPFTVPSELPDGAYRLRLRATSPAGGIGGESRTFTVDSVAPETKIIEGVPPLVQVPGTVAFDSSEPGTFECSVDDAEWSPCSSPLTLPSLPPGRHSFEVRARDLAGNVDGTPDSDKFEVDSASISVRRSSGPGSTEFKIQSRGHGESVGVSIETKKGKLIDSLSTKTNRSGAASVTFQWTCDDNGSLRAVAFPAGARDLVDKNSATTFEVRSCKRRWEGSVAKRPVEGRALALAFTDRWSHSQKYKGCIRGPGLKKLCSERRTGSGGKDVWRTGKKLRPGRYVADWYVSGRKVDQQSISVKPKRDDSSGQDGGGYCSGGLCGVAIELTKDIARDLYQQDEDADRYDGRCSQESDSRFSCDAIVSGIVKGPTFHGDRYECYYGVDVVVAGGHARGHLDGSVSTNEAGTAPGTCKS